MSPFTKEMLEAQAAHWKEEAERQRKARFTEAILGLIALGLLFSFTLWYVAYQQSVSDRRWCSLMVPLDDRNQQIARPTPEQQEFIKSIHYLRQQMHCRNKSRITPSPTPTPKESA